MNNTPNMRLRDYQRESSIFLNLICLFFYFFIFVWVVDLIQNLVFLSWQAFIFIGYSFVLIFISLILRSSEIISRWISHQMAHVEINGIWERVRQTWSLAILLFPYQSSVSRSNSVYLRGVDKLHTKHEASFFRLYKWMSWSNGDSIMLKLPRFYFYWLLFLYWFMLEAIDFAYLLFLKVVDLWLSQKVNRLQAIPTSRISTFGLRVQVQLLRSLSRILKS